MNDSQKVPHFFSRLSSLLFLWILVSFSPSAQAVESRSFLSGQPVWVDRRETEMNLIVGFRAVITVPEQSKPILRVAASTVYRAFLNGEFLGYGPARGPHGFYRIDEWDLQDKTHPGKNIVAVEVAGYNVNSFYTLDQPSFLQAEVTSNGDILASTAGKGTPFQATIEKERVQKVQRYSFQRPFSELYRLTPDFDAWRNQETVTLDSVPLAAVFSKTLLPRRVAYPLFEKVSPIQCVSQGKIETGVEPASLWRDRSLTDISPVLKGYPESELDRIPSIELQKIRSIPEPGSNKPTALEPSIALNKNSYHTVDFGMNRSGFLGATLQCTEKASVFFTFDEILSNGDVDFKRLGCVNIIAYELEPGTYRIESFEPYTLRFLKMICLQGQVSVSRLYLREYTNPEADAASFACSDPDLNRLFEAARETFRQNTVDLFMDCPSRERAGWCNDSLWTARANLDLTGNTKLEHVFFENFLLPDRYPNLPDGMLPMCYPADHYDGVFIPNWTFWLVLHLEEYRARGGDEATVTALKPKILKLLEYFKAFENEDGLLEKLQGWVFVEWSKANDLVQDVNYPTNMTYAAALEAVGRLYQMPELLDKAKRIKQAVRSQSFDGEFFVDNAVRKNGKLEPTGIRTEACQYYAFFFGVASPETDPGLWKTLREKFGPTRNYSETYPEIHKANIFIGDFLRLELLSQAGLQSQLLKESKDYYMKMVDLTGTLWEHDNIVASCDHGFTSHVSHLLYRDVLGFRNVDVKNKKITLRFSDVPIDWCEGRLPVGDGFVQLVWKRIGKQIRYDIRYPAGFEVTVEPGRNEVIQGF